MDYLIISGCNDNYILTMIDFIKKYSENQLDFNKLIIYVYSLNETNLNKIIKYKNLYSFEIVKFDYSNYPEHVNLDKYTGLQCNYAFKPISIYNACLENPNKKIIWMDSANRFNSTSINDILNILQNQYIYSPIACRKGSIESIELHHIDVIRHFELENDIHLIPQRSSGLFGVDYSSICGKNIMNEWYKCSLNKNIIAPEGSSRNNHRQDQSVLSMLMYLFEKLNDITFINNTVRGISFWNKKDNSTIDPSYNKYQITNLGSNIKESLIYCKSYEEAIYDYCIRKKINKDILLQRYKINLVT